MVCRTVRYGRAVGSDDLYQPGLCLGLTHRSLLTSAGTMWLMPAALFTRLKLNMMKPVNEHVCQVVSQLLKIK